MAGKMIVQVAWTIQVAKYSTLALNWSAPANAASVAFGVAIPLSVQSDQEVFMIHL